MGNNKDKPYSLQDAKDEVAQTIYNFKNWEDFRSDGLDWRVYRDAADEVAEVYKEKATEELRKENEALKEVLGSARILLSDHGYPATIKIIDNILSNS